MFLELTNGLCVRVPEGVEAGEVRGVTADGSLVIESPSLPGYLVPLTRCCNATGKGSGNVATGVCCRACYGQVAAFYGGFAEVDVAVAR